MDVLDAGGMAQTRGPGARFELLLPAQGQPVFEQQTKPFSVIEAVRFGIGERPTKERSSRVAGGIEA